MKKLILIATVLLSTYSFAQKVKGNGNMTIITRTTANYDAISCSGFMDFELVKGTEGKIKIEGEENLLEYIVTEVKDNKLIVKTKDRASLKPSLNKGIRITIPFHDIDEVSLAGSGDLWNKEIIISTDLEVSLSGSGDVTLILKVDTLKCDLTGSGDIKLKGSTNNLEATLTGSGDINATSLTSNHTDITVTGSGDANVVSNISLKARVTGSGDIKYSGNPEKEYTKVSGSGSISKD
ncbi:head GIN domain-containing protein [Formosa maritima]|uniref:DUF2807 domain-containing protein n=1 Tax=Formosa maritima TaxID=2592046 RepID=A0A5D0GFG1_9FLAO|nr:head GIN domain-containing protein [Formosa maritima]TYA56352.1 DUF2807 domain-containing protein [Formosa maritima]